MCGGGNGKRAIAGGILWRERLYVGHREREVVVGTGMECVFEISIYICVQIYDFCGVHVNS